MTIEHQWYKDDSDVVGKVEYGEYKALIVNADVERQVEIIDTSDLTEYELTIQINSRILVRVVEAGLLDIFLELLGTAVYIILRDRTERADGGRDRDSGGSD